MYLYTRLGLTCHGGSGRFTCSFTHVSVGRVTVRAVGLHVALHTSRFDVSAVGAVGLHVALHTSRLDVSRWER